MSVHIGNTLINSLYVGNTKISRAYLGDKLVYNSVPTVYLDFYKNGQNIPASNTVHFTGLAKWSDIGNYYRLTVELYTDGTQSILVGLFRLFSDTNDNALFGSSKGNYPLARISGDWDEVLTMDRTFNKATAITTGFYDALINWINSNSFNVQNMNQAFANLGTNLDHAYDLYLALSTKTSITSHSNTFDGSGSTADRALIPFNWGGDLMPASTDINGVVQNISSNKTIWSCGNTQPDWTNAIGLYLFTSESVSTYAGVSMNRSRINNVQNSLQTSTGNPLYFRPAFFQFNSGSSGAFNWLFTTTGVNGSLASSENQIDMPGTLDFGIYGVFNKEYGTYDSSKTVYFGFLVTNADPGSWMSLTQPYALLYNSNYKNNMSFKWFFES